MGTELTRRGRRCEDVQVKERREESPGAAFSWDRGTLNQRVDGDEGGEIGEDCLAQALQRLGRGCGGGG